MRCIRPIKAGYSHDFNAETNNYSITFSSKNQNKELDAFQFECRKCLPCRLNIAREKAIRAYHEAQMHDDNIFLTLTYNEENLESPLLIYKHFQDFMKRLREKVTRTEIRESIGTTKGIPMMVTGEYGAINKRPHWHALIFNYRPKDAKFKYQTDRGDKVYESEELTNLWDRGNTEFGAVTIDSAGYVARYAAKKLTHGHDHEHMYHPIHKTSSKRAIGRSWIEKYSEQTFRHGYILLPNGQKSKIPRYYVDWARKHKPDLWLHYVTQVRPKIIEETLSAIKHEQSEYREQLDNAMDLHFPNPLTPNKVKETILKSKFKQLQERLKL